MRKHVDRHDPKPAGSLFGKAGVVFFVSLAALVVARNIRIRPEPETADARSSPEHRDGRLAAVPEQIPARGLADVLRRVVHEVSDDRIMLVAAGVTFYLLLPQPRET